jgi:hypothetical protein
MKKLITGFLLVGIATGSLFAQTTPDPALQDAKAKLEVVYDLGRVFGYIHTMDKEQKKLAVTATQAKALVAIGDKILAAKRIEPKTAELWLVEIEDKIITSAQLMFVDNLAIERDATSTSATGTGPGSTGGVSPIQSYLSGGAFNPMLDATKTLGKDFKAAYDYLKSKK